MPDETSSPGRLIAPIALVVCAVAFFSVVLSSGSGDGGSGERTPAAKKQSARGHKASSPRVRKATYTVKAGDTLGAIAEKTGITVEKLQELNPQLDPQALVSGQKIKLRE